jgi:hypothetical protein
VKGKSVPINFADRSRGGNGVDWTCATVWPLQRRPIIAAAANRVQPPSSFHMICRPGCVLATLSLSTTNFHDLLSTHQQVNQLSNPMPTREAASQTTFFNFPLANSYTPSALLNLFPPRHLRRHAAGISGGSQMHLWWWQWAGRWREVLKQM